MVWTILIQILSESPLFNGYEQLPYQQSTDGYNNQLAFDATGNMYYANRYYTNVSAQANTQFKTGSSTYLVNQYGWLNDVLVPSVVWMGLGSGWPSTTLQR